MSVLLRDCHIHHSSCAGATAAWHAGRAGRRRPAPLQCRHDFPKIPESLRRVVLASNNAGKLREFSALFAPLGMELVPQGELGVPEAEEPHVTFIENALARPATPAA